MKHNYKTTFKNIQLRPLDAGDIELLRSWRNNPENTRFLSKIPFITKEMQDEWFKRYLNNIDEICFAIYEVNELHRCVGSLSLHDFNDDSCFLGHVLIGDKEAHGKKIGVNASIAATNIAFDLLGVNTVKLTVFSENIAAFKVYQQAGFQITDVHKHASGDEEYTMTLCRKDRY